MHEPTHKPIGSKPALRTSKNSLTEKSEVNTTVASAVLRGPRRRSAAYAGMTSAISVGSRGFVGMEGFVMTCAARQWRVACVQIHDDSDVMGQWRRAARIDSRGHHDMARKVLSRGV